ncbi:hypothetical protein MUP77_22980, partial [Candidatus Bathyarchaeota archaeon]|nr:hypothetical protein [Candidatus Bathyarchaeota archaeon]
NLLDKIMDRYSDQDYALVLRNISPNTWLDMHAEFGHLLSTGKILEIGSHIQSGSQRIIKLMGQDINLPKWIEAIKDVEKRYPAIYLTTSIMVGFPSETDEDFRRTKELLNIIAFDNIYVYKYDERPNLPSLRLPGRIPEEIKKARYDEIFYLATRSEIRKRINRGHVFSKRTLESSLIALQHAMFSRPASLWRRPARLSR